MTEIDQAKRECAEAYCWGVPDVTWEEACDHAEFIANSWGDQALWKLMDATRSYQML